MYPYAYRPSSPYYASPSYYSSSPDRSYVIRRRRSGSFLRSSSWGSSMNSRRRWVERNAYGEPILVRRRSRCRSGLSALTDMFTSRPRFHGRSESEEVRIISEPHAAQAVMQGPPAIAVTDSLVPFVAPSEQALVTLPPPPIPILHSPYLNRFSPPHRAEGKHTCGACGKFRSPSYHNRHPLAPGQVPMPTLCRKCRDKGTDSDNSAIDSDLAERRRKYRRRLRRRGYSPDLLDSFDDLEYRRRFRRDSLDFVPRQRSFSRDSYHYPYGVGRRSYYRSSSIDIRPVHGISERVEFVDTAPPPLVCYSPRRRASRSLRYYDDDDDWEDMDDERQVSIVYSSRPRVIHRRSPNVIVRQRNSSGYRQRYRAEAFEPYPQRIHDVEETETRIRSGSRPPPRSARVFRVSGGGMREAHHRRRSLSVDGRRRVTFEHSPARSRSRGRSRTRESYTMQEVRHGTGRRRSLSNVNNVINDDHYSPPEHFSQIRRFRSIEAPSPPSPAPWDPQRRYLPSRAFNEATTEIARTLERTHLSPSPIRGQNVESYRRTRSRSRSLSGYRSPLRRGRSRSGFVEVAERTTHPAETVASTRARRARVRGRLE